MERITGLLTLVALLVVPSQVLAQGKMGVYVAPKFVYGGLMGHDTKLKFSSSTASGASTISMDGDDIFGGAIAVGYDFHPRFSLPLRAELEYAMFSNAKSDAPTRSTQSDGAWQNLNNRVTIGIRTLFANAYYDFRNSSAFTPYLGVGLGISFLNTKGDFSIASGGGGAVPFGDSYSLGKKSTTNFAWNVGGGVNYAFTDNFGVDLGYRFVSLGRGKTKKKELVDPWAGPFQEHWETKSLYTHQLMLGLRFAF